MSIGTHRRLPFKGFGVEGLSNTKGVVQLCCTKTLISSQAGTTYKPQTFLKRDSPAEP